MALQFDHIHSPVRAAESPEFAFGNPRYGLYRSYGKRLLDILIVMAALPMALLMLLPFFFLIPLDGGGIFYRQKRIGRDGRIFHMWKLRSMVPNAQEKLAAYLASDPNARAEWDKDQKLKMDPRITPVGRIIRKTSIDELPQLINVLTGEMSIVGPRPIMLEQKELYPCSSYYALRPGITGFWQVSERNETSFTERAPFDAQYYRELSLWTDIKVIFKTFSAVIRATGY